MPEALSDEADCFVPRRTWLSFEEIERCVRAFVAAGATKIRLTGGEPLLRPELPALVARLAGIDGVADLALTTNGTRLPTLAAALRSAGLRRLTVSLDSLDPTVFSRMSGNRGRVEEVLEGIAAAEAAGFAQLRINTVVQRGVNDHTVIDLLSRFRGSGHVVRLIEFMDVGTDNGWSAEQVVPTAEWLKRIAARWPLERLPQRYPGEVASRYRYLDGAGEIGFISAVSQPFCGDCTRARLSCDGTFYTCLFASQGVSLRPALAATDDRMLQELIQQRWRLRADNYSEQRGRLTPSRKIPMHSIGG